MDWHIQWGNGFLTDNLTDNFTDNLTDNFMARETPPRHGKCH